MIEQLSRIADIFAIFFFALGIYYFHQIPDRTWIEDVLFLFMIIGFIADTVFTIQFMSVY